MKKVYKFVIISIMFIFTLLFYSNKILAYNYNNDTKVYTNTLVRTNKGYYYIDVGINEEEYISCQFFQDEYELFPRIEINLENEINIEDEIISLKIIAVDVYDNNHIETTTIQKEEFGNILEVWRIGNQGFKIYDEQTMIFDFDPTYEYSISFQFNYREKNYAPVFSGETYFVTNIDNPMSLQEIKSHITAIDDYDGDVTENITLKEDNYTAYNSQIGVYTIIFQVNDLSNNIAELTVQVNVTDVTAPIITGQKTYKQSMKTLLDLNIVKDNLTVTDNYDTNLIIVQETDNYSSNYNIPGQYIVKYKAVDTSGNIGYYDVNIHVIDDILPVIEGSTKITKTYDEVLTIDTIKQYLTATDNIDGDITSNIILENDNYTGNGNKLGNYDITFSVTDNAGNKATHIVTIQVIDDLPPLFYVDEYFINVQEGINLTQNDIINLLIKTNQLTITSTTTIKVVDNEYLNNENQPGIYAYSLLVEDVTGKAQTFDLKIKVLADEAKTIIKPIIKNKSTFFSPTKWYQWIYAPFVWMYNIFQWLWNIILTIYNWVVKLF
jgi:hypothetical protein